MLIEYRVTKTGQCHDLESVPKGAEILCIDGKDFIARCENCGKPIVEGDRYHVDGEGVYICIPCGNLLFEAEQEEDQPQLVTREMALDAGDPSLEGQDI